MNERKDNQKQQEEKNSLPSQTATVQYDLADTQIAYAHWVAEVTKQLT